MLQPLSTQDQLFELTSDGRLLNLQSRNAQMSGSPPESECGTAPVSLQSSDGRGNLCANITEGAQVYMTSCGSDVSNLFGPLRFHRVSRPFS